MRNGERERSAIAGSTPCLDAGARTLDKKHAADRRLTPTTTAPRVRRRYRAPDAAIAPSDSASSMAGACNIMMVPDTSSPVTRRG